MSFTMSQPQDRYKNFILAIWYEGDCARFRLENPHTNERFGFKNLTALAEFLEAWTRPQAITVQIEENGK